MAASTPILDTDGSDCLSDGPPEDCPSICGSQTLYSNLIACFDCILYNGVEVTLNEAQMSLDGLNGLCQGKSTFSLVSNLTASATTT